MGSPPRVRGKVQPERDVQDAARITPAYAGKRIKLRKRHSICGDHPRACGEKTKPVPAGGILMGSPPPVRGKVRKDSRSKAPCWDHPRVCGEKDMVLAMVRFVWGSPPRVRGKVSAGKILLHDGGITPAYAGKSGSAAWHRWACRDHPRVCGEKRSVKALLSAVMGSPPRVRGKEGAFSGSAEQLRITPRVCGEK